jgi:hypothetical protein
MLDPDHPETPFRFAALHQISLIHKFANHITIATGNHRRDLYAIIEPAIIALQWLNRERFGNREEIRACLNELDHSIQQLADLQHDQSHVEEWKSCPACNRALTEVGTYTPLGALFTVPEYRYCEHCLEPTLNLIHKLNSGTHGFGLEAI